MNVLDSENMYVLYDVLCDAHSLLPVFHLLVCNICAVLYIRTRVKADQGLTVVLCCASPLLNKHDQSHNCPPFTTVKRARTNPLSGRMSEWLSTVG